MKNIYNKFNNLKTAEAVTNPLPYNEDDRYDTPNSILSLEDVFGVVRPIIQPENFNALRDAAMEEHIERSQSLKL